ncbi:MAG TPA: mannose-6-phosphate isomerase [Chloroflexi bacterium]|jgi:mannose-6-phosphate isomerase|nr:mannose-6-phosphate isomerase [Chloroflexota bacterium]
MHGAGDAATIYPLTFEPVFRHYVWGGRRLATLFGRALPSGIVAESWDISGHPDSPTRVAVGRWQGHTLPEVLDALGLDLVGTHSADMLARGRFPLLVKLLDANQDLSVQVHPDDAYAARHENGEIGKTEMWYVLHTDPHYSLVYGLKPGVTPDALRSAIARDRVNDVLHRQPVLPGDTIDVPAGTVHALLAGAVVAEIQQTSDVTYRLYDWGRVGLDGKPRPLHIDRAMDVIAFDRPPAGPVPPQSIVETESLRRQLLVRRPQFTAERILLGPGATYDDVCDGSTFEIWGCMEGSSTVTWAGAPVDLPAVRFMLLPAALGAFSVTTRTGATLLRTYI